jgi:hypothetical protein
MIAMKMSRIRSARINQIIEATDRATTPEKLNKVVAAIDKLSWDGMRDLVAGLDKRDYEFAPWMLTRLVNLDGEKDLESFREEIPEFEKETDKDVLRLRDEVRAVWGKPLADGESGSQFPRNPLEKAVRGWFNESLDNWDRDRWLLIPELGLMRPVNNLAGSVARAMFHWHKYCFTCPACNGKRYVARRADQKYCLLTEECKKYGHRAAARRHYQNSVGKNRRSTRKAG